MTVADDSEKDTTTMKSASKPKCIVLSTSDNEDDDLCKIIKIKNYNIDEVSKIRKRD